MRAAAGTGRMKCLKVEVEVEVDMDVDGAMLDDNGEPCSAWALPCPSLSLPLGWRATREGCERGDWRSRVEGETCFGTVERVPGGAGGAGCGVAGGGRRETSRSD